MFVSSLYLTFVNQSVYLADKYLSCSKSIYFRKVGICFSRNKKEAKEKRNKETNKQTDEQTRKLTYRQNAKQIGRKADRQAS